MFTLAKSLAFIYYIAMPNLITKALILPLLVSAALLNAAELTDFKLNMNREAADSAMSKDYKYAVLKDSTVRRTWALKNRNVSMDFRADEDKLICITLEYTKPAPVKVCVQDAEKIVGEELRKWRNVNDETCEKIGMKRAMGCQTSGGYYVFREKDSDDKCMRMLFYVGKPESDRSKLEVFEGMKSTALGASGTTDLTFLLEDEYARKAGLGAKLNAPTPTVEASTVLGDTSLEINKSKTVQPPKVPVKTALGSNPSVAPQKNKVKETAAAQPEPAASAPAAQPAEGDGFVAATDPLFSAIGMGGVGAAGRIVTLLIALFLIVVLPLILIAKSSEQKKAKGKPVVFPAGGKAIRPLNSRKRR